MRSVIISDFTNLRYRPDLVELSREITEAGWILDPLTLSCLSPDRVRELRSVLLGVRGQERSFDGYRERARELGFADMSSVLDVGCGSGPWSAALASLNQLVLSCDSDTGRLRTAESLMTSMSLTNHQVFFASAENLSCVSSDSVDGVLCHGVFMFTAWERTLHEFLRVLRPGGQVYVTINSPRYYLDRYRQYRHGRRASGSPRFFLAMVVRSLSRSGPGALRPEKFESLAKSVGFQLLGSAPLGMLKRETSQILTFPGVFSQGHNPGVFEFLLTKPN